jgi:eukaryotic-like serine/threonine-protein kinase
MMLSAGEMVAGYRIERSLGAGGMGAVYLAQDPHLPRLDALKVLSADLSRDPDFRARFVREANVASKLDHPNIVSVYNAGKPRTASCGSPCSSSRAPTPTPRCVPAP